jgi:rod shape-determining protein MreD
MTIDILKRVALFVILCLAQALVFNHIHLLGYATVLLYVYFVVIFPLNMPKWASLLWSFFLGLTVDLFSNTPGMAAASLTLTGLLQPYLLAPSIPREAPENIKTSAAALGFWKFTTLAFMLVFIHCLTFFTIEAFGFFNWQQWAISIVGTTLLTTILLMALESIRR